MDKTLITIYPNFTKNIFLINLFILFIYCWLRWFFIAVCRLSLVGGEQGLPFIAVHVLLIIVASLVAEHGL